MHTQFRRIVGKVFGLGIIVALTSALLACGASQDSQKNRIPGDTRDLNFSLQNFHKDFRWGRYELAADFIDEAYKYTFLGRYEELGEDFQMVGLTVKKVEIKEDFAEVEVEQEWYTNSEMVVHKERYIEVWINSDKKWLLKERVKRDEYREKTRHQSKND